jgi:hypothetical protein
VWAAAFDTHAAPPVLAGKTILPGAPLTAGIRLGDAELANDRARGEVLAGGHEIAWDLRWTPALSAARRGPRLLEHVPLPTHVAHAGPDLACSGWVAVDGVRRSLEGAPGIQKHIWGTRRVEELGWLYCPRFEGDSGARLEATAVRPRRGRANPWLTFVWARLGARELDWCGFPYALTNRVEAESTPALVFRAVSPLHMVRARAWCDPRTLAGYVYRDPSGFDLYVAQSDVASCEMTIATRPHPFAAWQPSARLAAREAAALEFHGPEPLPGVRYIEWDATAL